MGKFIDLTGQRFGCWEVLNRDLTKSGPRAFWNCVCVECYQTKKSLRADSLKISKAESCGCLKDLTGKKFGRLTVLEQAPKHIKPDGRSVSMWKCVCDCNNQNITIVSRDNLISGHTQSCGCLQKEATQEQIKDLTGQKFGKLTVLKRAPSRVSNKGYRTTMWECICDCEEHNIVEVAATNLTRHKQGSCGKCNFKSCGEETISSILQDNNIKFEKEKTFEDCFNPDTGRKLRYDFYLPDYNLLIEFDGEQHFDYTGSGWNTKGNLEDTQKRDQIKNEYALSHNIKLIRIPYWERNNITIEMLIN